jgi:hypothetical protein
VAEENLSPEVIERIRKELLQQHPEMEGAEMKVTHRRLPSQLDVAAKAGFPVVELPAEPTYTVTLRKEVAAEDGVKIPLIVRVTVNAQGRTVKRRVRH